MVIAELFFSSALDNHAFLLILIRSREKIQTLTLSGCSYFILKEVSIKHRDKAFT
jgi:hypothetical protein